MPTMATTEPARPASSAPAHATPQLATNAAGTLLLGGQSASELAAHHGTPLYVIDSAQVRARVAEVRALLPAGMRLHYAIKANPLPELLRLLAALVDGFDIASGGELALALDAGHRGADLGFAGPGKRDDELRAAIEAGAVVNAESAGELARLAALAHAAGRPALAALRVNPDFELRQSGMRMGGGAQVFGIDSEDVPAVLATWPAGVTFAGFHIYAGSQNLNGEQVTDALRRSHALCAQLAAHAPGTPRVFNLGGGFGIPYFAGDRPLDTAPIRVALADIAGDHAARWPDTALVLELGRYLVGEAGVFLTRVIDRKRSRGRDFLVCDGGMHQHLAASGNFGQVIRRDYPIWLARDMAAHGGTAFTVCGPLCTPLDVLGREVMLPADVSPGDVLAIGQSGAYGASASPAGFLSHPPAGQILV
jgi:diaminopimelate decarboxylase